MLQQAPWIWQTTEATHIHMYTQPRTIKRLYARSLFIICLVKIEINWIVQKTNSPPLFNIINFHDTKSVGCLSMCHIKCRRTFYEYIELQTLCAHCLHSHPKHKSENLPMAVPNVHCCCSTYVCLLSVRKNR